MSSRVVTPSGRIGTVAQVRDGVALVRHGRSRAYYALRDLTPAPAARVSEHTKPHTP